LSKIMLLLAIPLFAQRYHFACEQCHTVIPELNAFGRAFLARGLQLPLPRHGTTGIALRYQLEYQVNPVNSRRWTPGGILLTNWDIGAVSAFVHYNLGAQGGPAGLYLGFLTTYNAHTQTLYTGGLFELPLWQSPGQRLDDLQQYGYYGAHVGLNDLTLASPRWGGMWQRTIGSTVVDAVVSTGEFKGAPYGGAPVPTGATTSAEAPEISLWGRAPLGDNFWFGAQAMEGTRSIVLVGKEPFNDPYDRAGLDAAWEEGRMQLQGEQWWGRDFNADGFGTLIGSSGGYVRLKYYIGDGDHAYVGVRYDAYQNPIITRDVVYYGALMIFQRARIELQQVQTIGGTGSFGGALTLAIPAPLKM
ncbi:MAG TPA: hypothetical protein VF741_08465, partial [Candidatus Aquilonibacter sp.]